MWDYQCRALPTGGATTNCQWTNSVNVWDGPVNYQCPGEGFITGMASQHSNSHEDRVFQYRCCDTPGTISHNCYFTGYENAFDEVLDYVVPNGQILKGMDSYHDNHHEDRRFKFEICTLERR